MKEEDDSLLTWTVVYSCNISTWCSGKEFTASTSKKKVQYFQVDRLKDKNIAFPRPYGSLITQVLLRQSEVRQHDSLLVYESLTEV